MRSRINDASCRDFRYSYEGVERADVGDDRPFGKKRDEGKALTIQRKPVVVDACRNTNRAVAGMTPCRKPISNIPRSELGEADDASRTIVQLTLDASSDRPSRRILKPTTAFDLLVDPVAARIEHVRRAAERAAQARKESAEVAAAMKEVRVPEPAARSKAAIDVAFRSAPCGPARGGHGICQSIPVRAHRPDRNAPEVGFHCTGRLDREDRASPPERLQSFTHRQNLRLPERRRDPVGRQVYDPSAHTSGAPPIGNRDRIASLGSSPGRLQDSPATT